jgi:predicted Ser/Thr protein kinase
MTNLRTCPDEALLRQFALGDISPAEAGLIGEHLAGCEHCVRTLDVLRADDVLAEALRTRKGTPGFWAALDSPLVAQLIERLSEMRLPEEAETPGASKTPRRSGEEEPRSAPLWRPSAEATLSLSQFLAPPQEPGEIGRLGPYRVLQVLGAGGMGVVFKAEDTQLQRVVALKVMKRELAASIAPRERFLREARAMAAVKHEHVATVYQVGEDRVVPFLAMELLEGETLESRLRHEGRLPVAEAVRVGREVATGLAAAHARGLIHRDVKPTNLWLEAPRGRVKILDFGLARVSQDDTGLTRAGQIVGTPAYMAPEQARGEAVDGRADLFSLGCVLYRALTGHSPFERPEPLAVLEALANSQPPPPCEANPDVPPALSDLVLRLLAKDPAQRPASAQAVAEALEAVEREPPARVQRVRRRPGWVAAGLAVLAAAAVLGAIIIYIKDKAGRVVGKVTLPDGGSFEARSEEPGGAAAAGDGPADGRPPALLADRRAAEWVLSLGGGVSDGAGQDAKEIRSVKDLPAGAFQVVAVNLWGNIHVNDTNLERIKPLTNLAILDLRSTHVSDAGLEHLRALTKLTTLLLAGTRVTDAGLKHLTGLRNLAVLNLHDTQLGDTGLERLKMLTSLGVLWLGRTRVGDAGLEHLRTLKSLKILELDDTQVSDAGLKHLEGLRNLTQLNLRGTRVGDAGLEHVKMLTTLEMLWLGHTRVSDAGLEHLRTLKSLKFLELGDTRVSDAGLEHLQALTNLVFLDLNTTRVGDAGMTRLHGLTNLQGLELTGTQVTGTGLGGLRKVLPKCHIRIGPAPAPPP